MSRSQETLSKEEFAVLCLALFLPSRSLLAIIWGTGMNSTSAEKRTHLSDATVKPAENQSSIVTKKIVKK